MQKISENDMYVYADNIPGFNMQSILEFGMYVSVPDYMPSVHQLFVAPFDSDPASVNNNVGDKNIITSMTNKSEMVEDK